MRSMIAKLAILLALPLSLLAGCSGSIEGEVRKALSSEKTEAVRFQKVATAYVRSCVETVRVIAADQIQDNPFALIQILQYCSGMAERAGEKLTSLEQAAALGCIQAQLQNNGLPQNAEQEAALVATCSDLASTALGRKKEAKEATRSFPPGATAPSGGN